VLEERLFAASGSKPGIRRRAEPDWAALVREMKRPRVNLTVLWEEYGAAHPAGYGYSRFCELYRDFEHRLSPTMRQHHVAGDKLFVDYSGKTVPIVDRGTGEVGAHVHMFAFFQGCPRRRARQPQVGHPQAVILRPGDQPHLRPDDGALRGRHPAGTTVQTA
jgi:transposase